MRNALFILFFISLPAHAKVEAWESDATPLHRAQKAMTDVIVHDIFSPPVASRIYAYTNLAAYEVLVKQYPTYNSLHQQVKTFPEVPKANGKFCTSLAAVYACLTVGKSLIFSQAILQDSINSILKWYDNKKIKKAEYDASLTYGTQVATIIMQWAAKDKYRETRSLRRYNFLKQEGKWMPTPPVYMAAVEPYWNRIRPLVLDSCSQFKPAAALPFSSDKNSLFYQQAAEVYNAGNALTAQQKAMASFWDCNPFAVTTEGHLNYAIKKISPNGHWMAITNIVCRKTHADIMKSSAAYSLLAIALFDNFISCWDEKYRSNVIRPETFINKYIDESWRPLLQTPPFPEYSSGHSVISTAAAQVLTNIFSDKIAFDDDTEVEFGLPIKHFSSFTEACNEAALSRLYGGIHYRAAIENGQKQGRAIGEWILTKIRLAK